MPCNSDYMNPNNREIEMSKVASLLDELEGKPIKPDYWSGYHPNVYSKGIRKEDADIMTSKLCHALRNTDVTKYSLEMQIWWRDHQKADAERLKAELASSKVKKDRDELISRLNPYERSLLGISETEGLSEEDVMKVKRLKSLQELVDLHEDMGGYKDA
jgi:hypothetical protein